jgi:hypothetical protein
VSDILSPPSADILPATEPPATSPNRLLANRANALHSTGPRTPEGKARSAQNALIHGLRARLDPTQLVPQPEQAEYAAFHEDLSQNLDPQSPLEHLLVERIALLGWKLRRHAQAEAHLMDNVNQRDRDKVEAANRAAQEKHDQQLAYNQRYRIKTPPPPPNLQPLPDPQPAAQLLTRFAQTLIADNPLNTLQRYESATERAFYKALTQYRILKTAPTNATDTADLHHHFHYHRHTDQTPSPPSNCAKFPNEPNESVPTLPKLPEPLPL